tara:strand:- start:17 stop:232 length:216 start_codon:yes stop_codon:yes gene_type:complete
MSAEKIHNIDVKNVMTLKNPGITTNKNSGRVDINKLMARVRKEKQKENKLNLVFFGLFGLLVLIVGIILSF